LTITPPDVLLSAGRSDPPLQVEVARAADLMVKCKGVGNFVEECSRYLPQVFLGVGQRLSIWVAKAKHVKEKSACPISVTTFLSGTQGY